MKKSLFSTQSAEKIYFTKSREKNEMQSGEAGKNQKTARKREKNRNPIKFLKTHSKKSYGEKDCVLLDDIV